MLDAGQTKSTLYFLKLYRFMAKIGIRSTNMLVLEALLKQDLMPRSISTSS
jgi:hypothetical protein